MACPDIAYASVHGVPDPIRGQQVVAVVQPAPTALPLSAQQLADICRSQLESYKVPKRFYSCPSWPMTPSGKTDHIAIAQALPCLTPIL